MMLSFLAATSSCEHKDLCYHHPHGVKLRVQYDWKNVPEALVKGMTIYFYPEDGGHYIRFNFSNIQGGYIELSEGTYNVVTYNNDTEGLMFGNVADYESHNIYTREGDLFEPIYGSAASSTPRAAGSEKERVVITPDMMWGCVVTKVVVAETGVKYTHETITGAMDAPQLKVENTSEDKILTFYPEEFMCYYTYEIRNVENMDQAAQMCASLSGMSGGLTFSSNELFKECVTLPFSAKLNQESHTITGEFYTFGHHEDNTAPHRMILYVWMTNGDKFYFGGSVPDESKSDEEDKFDVTNQIHNAPDKRRVHIIIDGLVIPKPIQNGSGYNPSVDDWMNEYHDIYMK